MAICYLFIMLYTLHRNNYFFYTLWKLILSSWYTLFETLCFAVCREKDWPYTYWGEGEGMRSRTVSSSIHYSPRRPDSGTTKRREFPSRRHLRYFGISRYIYGTRTRESLVNLSHNSEYLTNTSPPLPAGNTRGSLAKLEKNLSRHGADNAISKRLAGGERENWLVTRQHALPPSCSLFIVTSFDELQSQPR